MTEHRYTRYGSLQNKVVVITGGASGIGADLVTAFRQQESRVHFLDIDMTAGSAQARCFHPVDVRNIAALREAINNIAAQEGRIDVLINNAARDDRTDTFTVEPEAWRESLAVNLDHQFFASQAVAALMQKGEGGNIILTSSTSFMKGRPGMSGYTTSKAAIVGLSQTLARELGPSGIRVNCIVPGAISTPSAGAVAHAGIRKGDPGHAVAGYHP
jgi:NAD(P)-dependent dehydrogenase (short-subunit alcohol dehydrogenase family)